jgi:Ca2+-binding EF-hand superfamily protein
LKTLRARIVIVSNRNKEEFVVRNIFRSFECKNDLVTCTELKGLCSRLNVPCTDNELVALFKRMDVNNSGIIEFEEFNKLLLEDPY